MIECTDLFWHEFYKGAGFTLSTLLPLGLLWGGGMLALFRQYHRHEERMQQTRLQEEQARESRYRVVRGGQG
jgi:hypothetical protein